VLSIIFVPFAILAGLGIVFSAVEVIQSSRIPSTSEIFDLGLSVVAIFLAYSFVASVKEANRRLKQLIDEPSSNVHPMPVSFLESFFNLK